MNWFVTILGSIFICLPFVLSKTMDSEIKMIVDFLQSFNKPSNVIANLCWGNSNIKDLITNLANLESPKSIKFVNDMHTKDIFSNHKIIFLVDIACAGATQFLDKAKAGKYFGRPYRWLVINRRDTKTVIPRELEAMDILTDSEVYVSQFDNHSCNINLIYKKPQNHGWIIEKYGTWTENNGFLLSREVTELVTAIRRRNLYGVTVVASMIITDNNTLADMQYLRHKETDWLTKCNYHQLASLYDFANATRKLIFTNSWGYLINGSWTGILGDISQGKADLPGSVLVITKERMEQLDYLAFLSPIDVKFIFREPPLSYQNNLYLLPFKTSVWFCIGPFVGLLIFAMYVNAYWDEKKCQCDNEEENQTTMLIPKVSDVSVFVMSAISQQGSNVELKGTLGRFVILIIFLVFLFLYTAYSASIVVLLQASSNQIRTLSDLLNSKLELGVEDTKYNRYFISTTKDPVKKAIYETKIAPKGSKPKFYNLVDGILELQKKPFAFNCVLGTGYRVIEKYFYEHEKCGLQEIQYIQIQNPYQAVKRGSPYREIFKIGLLRNAEHGLNDRTNRIMLSKKPVCLVRGGSFVSVSLVDCYPIFLLLMYGMILGQVLLLAELIHHRRMKKVEIE
uniref:Ionotropic receptor IR10 n=1 Tax=Lobesia botrana TaxID=209534 RepID=A0A345BF17_9NEOP|nr:ionotropic receptor IR10 [Lobesia botrana]